MATKVGPKGQVVIEERIRRELGIQPGMTAIQRVVGDHVELRFVPAPHRRSLAGAARPFIKRYPPPDDRDDLDDVWVDEVPRRRAK
jgi:bifunctional DNA-binding transcriptional regulator/antitoxin component of YhaV-PrlF toxin-antitoxin module